MRYGALAADVVTVVMGVAMLVMCAMAADSGSHNVLTGVFSGVVCFVPAVLRRLRIMSLPGMISFLIALAPFLHAMGLFTGAYDDLAQYDTVTHTLSSTVMGIIIFYFLTVVQYLAGGRVNFTGRSLAIFTALIALTFSVYWEVLEHASDMIMGSMAQYSPYDTLTDLVCDSLGTFIASAWAGAYMRGRTAVDAIEDLEISPRLMGARRKG